MTNVPLRLTDVKWVNVVNSVEIMEEAPAYSQASHSKTHLAGLDPAARETDRPQLIGISLVKRCSSPDPFVSGSANSVFKPLVFKRTSPFAFTRYRLRLIQDRTRAALRNSWIAQVGAPHVEICCV